MRRAFWNGRRVFVTGHTGFKGAWLTLWLRQLGAVVHGYALQPTSDRDLFEVAHVADGIEHEIGEIRDGGAVQRAIRDFDPEVVFHLAAQALVRQSYSAPVDTYAVNVMGTVNVLEAVRNAPTARAVVVVTSDKCYDNPESGKALTEADPMGGHDPYSSSKGCAELVTTAYARSFYGAGRCSVASVRAGNAIGGGDWSEDRIVPDIFRGLLSGSEIVLRNPAAIRPWQHVLEPLSGYLCVAERLALDGPSPWEAWNFGPDGASEQTVETIAKRCCQAWGRPGAYRVTGASQHVHEAGILRLDSSKARRLLGWRPCWTFDETIRRTVDWYRDFGAGRPMRGVTLGQIDAYVAVRPAV
ncbi:MAG: CDP-glucose 4,6-dehydratase [Alphaproteobacteria bacterium]|nr:CDP-glucose 4,6-dehydratase [Alphaproteobacteria bacterium]